MRSSRCSGSGASGPKRRVARHTSSPRANVRRTSPWVRPRLRSCVGARQLRRAAVEREADRVEQRRLARAGVAGDHDEPVAAPVDRLPVVGAEAGEAQLERPHPSPSARGLGGRQRRREGLGLARVERRGRRRRTSRRSARAACAARRRRPRRPRPPLPEPLRSAARRAGRPGSTLAHLPHQVQRHPVELDLAEEVRAVVGRGQAGEVLERPADPRQPPPRRRAAPPGRPVTSRPILGDRRRSWRGCPRRSRAPGGCPRSAPAPGRAARAGAGGRARARGSRGRPGMAAAVTA